MIWGRADIPNGETTFEGTLELAHRVNITRKTGGTLAHKTVSAS